MAVNSKTKKQLIEEIEKLRKVIHFIEKQYLYYIETYYEYFKGVEEKYTELVQFKLNESVFYYLDINLQELLDQSLDGTIEELLNILKKLKQIIELVENWDLQYILGEHEYDDKGKLLSYNIAPFNLSEEVEKSLGITYFSKGNNNIENEIDSGVENNTVEYYYTNYNNKTRKEIIEEIVKLRKIIKFIASESQHMFYEEIDLDYDEMPYTTSSDFDYKEEVETCLGLTLENVLDDNYEQNLNGTKEELIEELKALSAIIRLVDYSDQYYGDELDSSSYYRSERILLCRGKLFNLPQEVNENLGITLKKKPYPTRRK